MKLTPCSRARATMRADSRLIRGTAEHHRPQAKRGDFQSAGAKPPIIHVASFRIRTFVPALGTIHQTGLIGPHANSLAPTPATAPPTLTALFLRLRQHWPVELRRRPHRLGSARGGAAAGLDGRPAVPVRLRAVATRAGATNVNLAVFIGTHLRGIRGALACFLGLTAPPVAIILILGALYFGMHGMPGGAAISTALSGMGAVAIGLNLGTGIRLARRGIRRVVPALITATVALSIGVMGIPLQGAGGDDPGQPAGRVADPAARNQIGNQLR